MLLLPLRGGALACGDMLAGAGPALLRRAPLRLPPLRGSPSDFRGGTGGPSAARHLKQLIFG
eukprot:9743603-Lingulodinium_polyedra.AAC.1